MRAPPLPPPGHSDNQHPCSRNNEPFQCCGTSSSICTSLDRSPAGYPATRLPGYLATRCQSGQDTDCERAQEWQQTNSRRSAKLDTLATSAAGNKCVSPYDPIDLHSALTMDHPAIKVSPVRQVQPMQSPPTERILALALTQPT